MEAATRIRRSRRISLRQVPFWRRAVALVLVALQVAYPAAVAAQTVIRPDGRTQTAVGNSGAVWNVSTTTLSGSNAFNSFNAFSVGAGNTVNLHVPSSAANLINIVRDQRTDIYGILNAIKDGHIGGNVWFANPHGFVVGASGVVNVGSLSVSTPTQQFVDNFFLAPGSPDQGAVAQLLSGTAPRSGSGLVSILGKVNATDGISLSAGAINVAGSIYSGARFVGTAPDFTDVVNANGLASATNVVVKEGKIQIVADNDVTVSGTIAAPGGAGVRGGNISIRAGGNVDLQSGAIIAAHGSGANSAGGTINIWAENDAVARKGAIVDASAGGSGDGGAIEFSAKNTVELAGGEFRADGMGGGKAGSVLIDPWNIVVSADILRGASGYGTLPDGGTAAGANLTLLADNEITVNENITISTRSVAGTATNDHATGASTADSGNLTLEAGSISLKSGSKLLAGADNGFTGGDVTLKATRNWTGEAKVSVDNATITGRNVALTANATYNDSILTSWLPVVVPVTVSTIDVNSGTINASGALTLGATSLIDVSSSGLSPLGMITAVSAASVDVRGASVLTAGGNTTLASSSTVASKATPGGPNPATLPGDAGVATNVVVSTAKTRVGDSSSVTVSGGSLDLSAKNTVTATTTADASAGGAVAIGGTLALSEVTSVTQAVIDGSATTSSTALKVGAESTSVVTTSAKAASKGAKKQTAAEKAAAPSETEKTLDKYKDQTTTSDGSVDVAAAVAIANVNNITLADIASTGTQTTTGAATVSSKASSTSAVTADGSSAGGTVGVGAAVGANIGVLVNQARVADNANVSGTGLTVSAVMPTAGKNSFVTTATSGAGASNVGVAGALGTNVLVNTTVATVEGDKDSSGSGAAVNTNSGDVVVEAANTSESKVTAGASVKPASGTQPAAVGVGASVGMNVAVNTTVAEIGNGAGIGNANDLGLTAKGVHTLENAVTGGAAGANVSVTPVAAVTVAVNTTTARLGTGSLLNLSGAFAGSAEQSSSSTTTATGQTQGNNVAVGVSIALNNATDTVTAEIDRDVTADDGVEVNAKSVAKSSASATASVAGGEKETASGTPPAAEDGSDGKTVDEKVTAQGDAAKDAGKKTTDTAAANSPASAGLAAAAASSDPDTKKAAEAAAANSPASAGLAVAAASSDSKTKVEQTTEAPKTEDNTESGGVSVAAAVGVNVGVATTVAKVGSGRSVTSSGGALKVTSANETDTSAKADGSQVDPGNTSVGVGAAVALNAGISTNVASVGDDAVVNTKGLTVSAINIADQKSDSVAEAKSGAGAGNVGLAGSLAANVVVNTTVAALEGDVDNDGTGATVTANSGDILIEAANATTAAVKSGADVKGTGGTAKVGVGASLGVNVGVNTTVAEVADKAVLGGGKDLGLNAKGDHTLTTEVTGGAAGAKVAVTPLVAATVAVNTTTARLGAAKTGDAGIGLSGKYSSTAEHKGSATTTATGQTQGNSVAVGASIGLTVAVDTVTAGIERNVAADGGVEVNAKSSAKSSTSATASVAGGEKAKDDGTAPAPGGGAGSGQSVDQKVAGQQTKATAAGKATAAKAPATTPAAGSSASDKLDTNKQTPPKAETSEGGVSVAAAVGVNVGVATTTASIGRGRTITSAGALKVESAAQTDASAKADGSQVDSGNTDVGVGAAVALNVGVATSVAKIGDDSTVTANGVTVSAVTPTGQKNDFAAEAKSGAGAGNVGVAGSLAANVVVNTTYAGIEGNENGNGTVTSVAAGSGDVLIAASNATTSTVTTSADVKGTDDSAKVGVGASLGVNVAVNTTVAEIGDGASLTGGRDLDLKATADHVMSTTVSGGAAGAKVSVTPVAAVSIAVNTTTARAGDSTAALGLSGKLSAHADQTDTVTTKATGRAQGDVAVGASLAAAVVVETVSASVERDVGSSTGIDLGASSESSVRTEAVAGAKGAKAAAKDPATGEEKPEAGTTVDEQKKNQLDFAKSRNEKAATLDTDTKAPKAETPEVNKNETTEISKDKNQNTTGDKKQESKKVSVAAAIGVGVVANQATATIGGAGRSVRTTGTMDVKSATDTNYETMATGEAVSDNVGVAAAVALTGTYNKTQANVAAGTTVVQAGDINVTATANQNRDPAFRLDMGAEAVSGASGGDVAVAGALAVVGNYNETRASIDEQAVIGTNIDADPDIEPVGNITVQADETSKVAARARAGSLSTGKESKAGVGASFAAILSYNKTTAAAGYDTAMADAPSNVYANSLTVAATKHKVEFVSPLDVIPKSIGGVQTWVKNFDFDTLDPLNYLGSNNYYTEAVAGAAAKGDAAVAGAFSVNLFMNTTEAYLGKNFNVTTSGRQAGTHSENLGVEVAARSDTKAIAFAGAVAGAKQAGVGISNTDIVNYDETNASIGSGSIVKVSAGGTATDNGAKVTADASQVVANVSVSGGLGTGSTGVGGVLGVNLSMNKAEAAIADGAQVQAEGNVTVGASNDTTLVMIAGGVGGGKEVGVGGAIALDGVWNRTLASIGKDAVVDAKKNVTVAADADETVVSAVVSGAGGGKAGVAASLSFNVIVADTEASVGQGAKLNTSAGFENAEKVAITAQDDTVVVGVSGGGAGAGDAGVGAALDTAVVVKKVKAFIADDTVADGKVATVKADKEVAIDAAATEAMVSIAAGFAGGGKAGVGGSVSIGVVANEVQAYVGKSASVDTDGNVLVNAQDDTTAVLTAMAGAGGGQAGVGGSLAVATLVGSTKAYVGESAQVNARGLGDAASVYTGATGKKKEAAKGLSVTAYNTENVVTTDVSGAGGGNAGVAVSVSANVIANTAEAYIGRSAKINETNAAAGVDQQVRVKAIDETVLVNNAGGAGFGGSAGVGAAANIGVIVKNTKAWIGSSALVNARKAVELGATSSEVAVSGTLGFAIGGSAGVGASLGGVGLGNTTEAYIEDAAGAASAAKVNVSGGDLSVEASDLATTTLLTGGGGGGGSAGVGGAIAVNVNASTTKAKIGNYAETNASGTTAVHADSVENTNTVTVAGAGGGSAGVGGAASIKVVVSKTEAGIGDNAKVNQDAAYQAAGQSVDVKATDKIITVGVGGVGAGGGAAGVGGSADLTVVLNTTSAYIGNNAKVAAVKDVKVDASSEKYVNSATFAGAGGGSAGVAGGISIISVGSLLDGEARSGLSPKDENGNPTTTQKQADDLTTTSSVGDLLGSSAQSQETKGVLDGKASKMAISSHVGRTAPIDFKNTQAFIGNGAEVKAGENVTVSAKDTTLAILAAGAGAGGGAAGVAGTLGVVLLHDSAEAFIADNAKVDAGKTVAVNAQTGENVFNVAVTGAGAGAAAVNGSIVVNVVSSDTAAYIGAADINKDAAMDAASTAQSVDVGAKSSSNLVAVAGAGNGAGAAAVGGVLNVNTLVKRTKAYIARDADVAADENVTVAAASAQNVVAVGASFGGAGAAAVSAAAEVNVVANVTEAFIGAARGDADKSSGATVDSDGNVSVSAVDDTLVVALSAVGNGAGAAAVGGIVGANVISSQTRAYVSENSAVNARGTTAGTEVYSGTIADATAAQKPPAVPGGGSGDIDIDRDGTADGNVGNGASLTTKTGSGTQSTVNPGAAKDADGNPIAGASGGLGTKGTETVKGLSVLAMGNEKFVTATIGVAGAGAAAVTGAATANVISSETEASIKDGAQINMSGAAGADPAVRVRAADNTFMVQAGGTVTGAGAAAVSGTVNTGIVAKKTTARIGDADVNASDVEVTADSSEKVFTLTANVSIAGAAGVGAGVGVNVIANETSASIGAGANIDATDDISVDARQNSLMTVNTVAVAGGIAGVGGAFSVGVIANKTKAYVEGSDDLTDRTTLNAGGNTAISAVSEENLVTATVSGAGGVAGVTGAFGIKVVKSDTDAYIGKNSSVTADEVEVNATDTIRVVSVGGAATGGLVGVGGTVDATIVLNTTSAHIDSGASVDAVHDVKVEALSDKLVNSTTFAGSGGAVGVAGAVSIISVGSLLDGEAKSGLNGDDTGSLVDSRIKEDKVSTQLGSSEHVQGVKSDVANRTSKQGVAADLKGTVPPPLKNTMAFIGSGAQVAAGDNVTVKAVDKTLAIASSGAGAVGAFAGVAGTVGVVLLHDSAEAFVANGAWVDAGKTVTVAAETGETVVNTGITGSGAAGVAAGGSVVVNAVTSDTEAYIGDADINRHSTRNANQSVAVTADSASNIVTVAGAGGVAGGASIGGVINVNALKKNTKAYIASGADVAAGKTVDVVARSAENVIGAGVTLRGAGLGAAGAVISANVVDNTTEAYIDGATVDSDGNVKLSAVDDTLIVAVSAVANGAGGVGVGLNVGANVVSNETRAYVVGPAEINARGNSATGSEVYTGTLSTTPGALPALPAGQSGSADIDRDGTSDGSMSGGASFNVGGKTVDPAAAKASDGSAIAGASGGLGAKNVETVKGLSVVAMNNEKVISATVGVAVAGGRSQTGASTTNVIGSVTEASIGDGAKINMSGAAGTDPSVRVRAADNTLMVQVGGTFAGAGAMGLSGAIDSGIVTKQTTARIGDADVKAGNVEVTADASEDVYNVAVNAALAGGAGVGGAVGVDVIRNKTFASIGAGADIDATGDIRVSAKQRSAIDLYTVSGAVAGLVGASGAVSVGVIANETKAYVEGSTTNAASLDAAGTTAVVADSTEKITGVTVSGAAGGLAGVAGAVGVKVVESKTEAFIGDHTRVNQASSGAAQDVVVSATDAVTLRGGGGTVALAGYAGVGATAEINIVRNTTTAYIGDATVVDADRDVSVSAASTKDVQSAAIAASGGLSVGIGGALSVVSIGAKLDNDSQGGLRDAGSGNNTATSVDSQISKDEVSGQLGGSEHVQGMKTDVSGGIGGLGVASKMNESSAASLDKTRAYIGRGSKVTAGDDIQVAATEKVKVGIKATGAAGGFVGIGGAIGVGITKSTTEAFVDSSTTLDAVGDVSIAAKSQNIDSTGSTVTTTAGAGGVVGASASVAVMDDTSTTKAYLGSNSEVQQAATLTVEADAERKSRADSLGASAGALAIGASVARASFAGNTSSYLESGVQVGMAGGGKTVTDVIVDASDASTAIAHATAGTAGILAGSGAVGTASVGGQVQAAMGDGSAVNATDNVTVSATATPSTDAGALGVNIGLGAVGASVATAQTSATTKATLGSGVAVSAASFDLLASREIGAAPSALARATGASGGLLLGANATVALAASGGETTALIGDNSTLTVSGTTTVKAETNSQQTSSGLGISAGFIAVGADYSRANSSSLTQAVLGDGVKLTGNTFQLLATGTDTNYAYGVAGSGGVASAPFSEASTTNTSQTFARSGGGDAARKVDVTTLLVAADHTARFDSWMDSTNASLIGVSGAKASNSVSTQSEAHLGTSAYVQADNIILQAHNDVVKASPATIPGLTTLLGAPLAAPAWNVNSSSGGLADLPAAGSSTTISARALTQVGAGAHLEQTGSTTSPGTFALDAWNNVTATDKVKMSSGGAISAASGKSEILADTDEATVRVGALAKMTSLGDMNLGARSVANLYSQAAVDVYGLVGVAPFGSSTARFQAVNAIDIGAGATLDSGRDIKLSAGASSGDSPNNIQTTARSDVYNNTAIPVSQDPVADAVIGTQSIITVGAGADLGAARNIGLYADKGTASASGVGIGKDIYREALAAIASAISNAFGGDDVSFETRTGRAIKTQASNVAVNGTVHTGTQREQLLVIGPDGSATQTKGNIGIKDIGWRDVAADIQDRITALDNLIQNYSTSNAGSDAAIAVAAYESEKKFLQRKLVELGYNKGAVAKSGLSALQVAQQTVAGMTTTISNNTASKNTLTTQNTTLTNDNTTLTNNNTTLTNNNTTLTADNNTLNNVTIPTLLAQRAALNTSSSTYATDYANLTNQINTAQSTVTSNNTTISNNNTTISNNNATIATNNTTIADNNTQIATLTTDINRVTAEKNIIQAKIDANQYSSTPAAGPMATFLTISDATAQLGNIFVRGDRLHGSGTLDSPGDAKITITNNGPNFLILKNLTILPDEGGKVYFNGVDVKSNADINQVNGAAGGAAFTVKTAETGSKPAILVESKYDPLDPYYLAITPPDRNALAPDIVLQGDISNLRGLVKIDSAAGSIRLEQKRNADGSLVIPVETASVRAAEVEIKTRNGDFVQSYSNTFSNTGGSPLTVYKDPITGLKSVVYTAETPGSGIVANGSVLIAARYLNINGIIQSGIPEWGVVVPSSVTVNVPGIGAGGSFAQAQAYYNGLTPAQKSVGGAEYFAVNGTTVGGLTGNQWGAWEKITVRYNAKENRLELAGVQVQGGYINLFGQIYNTNMAGGGELRVLDGYGQIKVDNQTSMPLWIATLDTGRGVQGQIDITNISGLNADGTPIITTTSYIRDPGASRTGYSYSPTAGLRYAMQVGKTTGRTDNYLVSNGAFFGIKALPDNLADYWVSGWYATDNPIPNNGEFLGQLPSAGTGNVASVTQSTSSASSPVPGASWFECNWLTLCAYGTYYTPFTVESSTRSITTVSLKADNPIGIKFIGQDNGLVNVNSTGNLVLNGSINNRTGNTALSSAGSITQNGALPMVGGNNVALSAGTGIGSSGQILQVNVKDGGYLNATSNSGDVYVKQMLGDMRIGSIGGAGVANVYLEADRSLLAWNASSFVQGQRVELVSDNGGIGLVGDPLVVRTGYTSNQAQWPNYGLKAAARDSINLKNTSDPGNAAVYSGNLLLISAESAAGDVRIETTGGVIDNNPYATTDTRTEAELAALWDSLRLRGALAQEKADEAVAAYKKGKETNYQLYWQLRQRQADAGAAYDAGFAFTFTTAERNALIASGMTEAQVSTLAANRTAQYHQLNGEVGSLTTSYVAGYSYTVSAAEDAGIRQGSSWTDAQLALSVGAGLLKNITDTVTTIKQPNAKGRSVTLLSGADIGSYDAPQTIDLSAGLGTLTTAQKAALAAAERGDASLVGNIITILQPRPVNVTVGSGALKAAAAGYALIGSEEDLRIDQVSALGDIRIKTAGSLINAASVAGAANVVGGDIILEAANGGIGSLPDVNGAVSTPLRVSQTAGSGLIGRAANDIWIESDGNLVADTLFSRGDMRLGAAGSILDFHAGESSVTPENNLLARNLFLTAQTGSIGTSANYLDAGVGRDGAITATALTVGKGIFLNGPAGEYFNIGSVVSGDAAYLSSATAMKVDGQVTAPGPISLVAGGTLTMTPWADVHATTLGVYLRAGALTMQDADRMRGAGQTLDPKYAAGKAARMLVDVGTIDIETVGDALITGIETGNPTESAIRVVSTAGRILDNGDTRLDIIADTPPAAKLTISGALGIGDDPLDVRLLNLQASSGGVVDLAVQNNVNIVAITAADRVLLTAGGDITGNSVTSTGTGNTNPDKSVSITSTQGSVNLASVSGQTDVSVSGQGGVSVGTLDVGTNLHLAGPQISAVVNGGAGSVGGSVTGFGGGVASDVNLTLSGPGGFAFSNFWAETANVGIPLGSFWVDNALILDQAIFTNPLTSLLVDQHNRSIQPSDVQLYSAGAPFYLGLSGNHVATDAFVIHRSPLHEVITPDGSNTSTVEQSEDALATIARLPGFGRQAGEEEDEPLIAYTGTPVSLEGECDPELNPDCRK